MDLSNFTKTLTHFHLAPSITCHPLLNALGVEILQDAVHQGRQERCLLLPIPGRHRSLRLQQLPNTHQISRFLDQ